MIDSEQIEKNKKKIEAGKNLTERITAVVKGLAADNSDSKQKTAQLLDNCLQEFEKDYDEAREAYREHVRELMDEITTIAIAGGVYSIIKAGEEISQLDPEDELCADLIENRAIPVRKFPRIAGDMMEASKEALAYLHTSIDLYRAYRLFVKHTDAMDRGEEPDMQDMLDSLK